jgi:UDP-glucuronate 4-epimerase
MAYYQFARDIVAGRPIRLFNKGHMVRDYTYIDDVVDGLLKVAATPATADPAWRGDQPRPGSSSAPWRILNLGGGQPAGLERLVELLETALGRKAQREYAAMPASDTMTTCADAETLERITGFRPGIPIEVGIPRFVDWFREYHARDFAT